MLHVQTYRHSVRLRATVCKSVMFIDAAEIDIAFDGCVLGKTYFRDFTVWNRAEIPLSFIVAARSRPHKALFTFTYSESGEPLEELTIPGFANVRVRVTYRPASVGEQRHEAIVSNINDPTNAFTVRVYSMTVASEQEKALVISSGSLDFGTCYAGSGVAYSSRITVRNITKQPLELDLRNSAPPDVSFHIVTQQATVAAEAEYGGEGGGEKEEGEQRADESRCTELNLQPGVNHELEVRYTPSIHATQDPYRYTLTRITFLVVLKAFGDNRTLIERRSLPCSARICVSHVDISTSSINLGDLTVGAFHHTSFKVF